jgi:hypothetical protein
MAGPAQVAIRSKKPFFGSAAQERWFSFKALSISPDRKAGGKRRKKMSVIIAHSTKMAGKLSQQERLEAVFHAVDTIKSDLNKCGLGAPDKEKSNCFSNEPQGFSCKHFREDKTIKTSYRYNPQEQTLERQVNKGEISTLLGEVSDFYVTYFPDANSVLYRIEVNKKEQIRGYIFLLNLVN